MIGRQRSLGRNARREKERCRLHARSFAAPLPDLYPGNSPHTKTSKTSQKNSPAAHRSFPALGEDPLFCDTPAVLKGGASAAAGNAAAAVGNAVLAAAAAAPASKATAGRPPRSSRAGAAAGLSPCPFSHDAFFRTVHALTGELVLLCVGI